jgi:hypothetical protein
MKRSDINWKAKKLFLPGTITKNGKDRHVPLKAYREAIANLHRPWPSSIG